MLFICDFCQKELNKDRKKIRFFMLPATRLLVEHDGVRDKLVQPLEEEYRTVCSNCLGV